LLRAWPDWLSAKRGFSKKGKMFAESHASKALSKEFF
jgi:hypothetical protein